MKRFEAFESFQMLYGITTRHGGVSEGAFATMNTSFSGGDEPICVFENIKRSLVALGLTAKIILACEQIHSDHIEIIDENMDLSLYERLETDNTPLEGHAFYFVNGADGIITNRKDVVLMTFYADCVPLMAYDPAKHIIANVHSGWRGTAMGVAHKMILQMTQVMGASLEDMVCGIGHSAGVCCYEVDQTVMDAMYNQFGEKTQMIVHKVSQANAMLDLKKANELLMNRAGVPSERIAIDPMCTICNPNLYHSHRGAKGGKRGSMSAFAQLL